MMAGYRNLQSIERRAGFRIPSLNTMIFAWQWQVRALITFAAFANQSLRKITFAAFANQSLRKITLLGSSVLI